MDELERFASGADEARNRAIQAAETAHKVAETARKMLPKAEATVCAAEEAVVREQRKAQIADEFFKQGVDLSTQYYDRISDLLDTMADIAGFEQALRSVLPERTLGPAALNLNFPRYLLPGTEARSGLLTPRNYDQERVKQAAAFWSLELERVADGLPSREAAELLDGPR